MFALSNYIPCSFRRKFEWGNRSAIRAILQGRTRIGQPGGYPILLWKNPIPLLQNFRLCGTCSAI